MKLKYRLLNLAIEVGTAVGCVGVIQYTNMPMLPTIGVLAIAFGGYQAIELIEVYAKKKEVRKNA